MLSEVLTGSCHLGIDIDDKNQFHLLRVYFNAKYMFPDKNVIVTETKKGFHVEVEGVETSIKIREIFGDDSARIQISEYRMRRWNVNHQDILYVEKTPSYGKKFRVEDFNILNYI